MNLLSRRSVLAIAAVVDIALHSRPSPVAAKALAARHKLPPRHLETLLQGLVHANILQRRARAARRLRTGARAPPHHHRRDRAHRHEPQHGRPRRFRRRIPSFWKRSSSRACARRASRSSPISTRFPSRISARRRKRRKSSKKRSPAPISRSETPINSGAPHDARDLYKRRLREPSKVGVGKDGNARKQHAQAGARKGRIYDSITDTIGDTPLVRLDRDRAGERRATPSSSPSSNSSTRSRSVKDRIGVAMIDALEAQGKHRARARRARRADLRQYRHRARLRRRGARLQADPRHARIDVDRAAQDAGAARRRTRADARRRRA